MQQSVTADKDGAVGADATTPFGRGLAALTEPGRGAALLSRVIPFAALFSVIVAFTIAAPDRFATADNFTVVVQQAAVTAILALGLTYVIITGSIDLSVGSVAALAGIVGADVAVSVGVLPGIAVALAVGAAAGGINGVAFAILKVPSFIATLGMLTMARGATLLYSDSAIPVIGTLDGLGRSPGIFYMLAGAFVVAFVLLNATTFGRHTRAVGGDERVAHVSGIAVTRTKIMVFVFSGAMAGLAGVVLAGRVGAATPTAAQGLELAAIAAVVIGGTPLTGGLGNVWNTILGALVISMLINGLVIVGVRPELQLIIQGLILVLAVFLSLERRKIGVIK